MATIWSLSKKDAAYGPAPTPEVRCDHCKYMFPPFGLGGAGWCEASSAARRAARSSCRATRRPTNRDG